MSKAKNNINELLSAIKRQTPEPEPPQLTPKEEPARHASAVEEKPKRKEEKPPIAAAGKKAKRKIGKSVQFWMHDEDTKLVRELSAWLAGQGVRPSDSLVIRAVLRYAKTGSAFLEAFQQASKQDGRLKRD